MNNIILLDCTNNYPHSFSAINTKAELLARGLQKAGDRVQIVNTLRGSDNILNIEQGIHNNIPYTIFPKKINQFLCSFYNIPALYRILKKSRDKSMTNSVIIDYPYMINYLMEIILCRFTGYKIYITYQEQLSSIKKEKKVIQLDTVLFDRLFGYFCDGIFPISSKLDDLSLKFKKPRLKVPILADYDNLPVVEQSSTEKKYFMYCAFAKYITALEIIYNSAIKVVEFDKSVQFILVLYGPDEYIQKAHSEIEKRNLSNNIQIQTNVSYDKLFELYSHAEGLLIPLDPTSDQDIARFSQKIAEYLSSTRPIITVNVGEIKSYFTHRKNAFVANDFTVDDLFEQMKYILENPEIATTVGLNGFKTGVEQFNYITYGERISNFIQKYAYA